MSADRAMGGTFSYSLAAARTPVRWAVTLFLALLGSGYAFGALMVTEWVGLGPEAVAEAYRQPETQAAEEMQVRERPIDLDQELGEEEVHRIDRRLLIQDTHVHVPVYALIALALAAVALGLDWPRGTEALVVLALFAGPALDFGGQWLTKLVADGFSYMVLSGGWLMAGSYTVVAANAVWQMWFRKKERKIRMEG